LKHLPDTEKFNFSKLCLTFPPHNVVFYLGSAAAVDAQEKIVMWACPKISHFSHSEATKTYRG